MSETRAPTSPVAARLSAAAGRILDAVRRMVTMLLRGAEMSPEHQSAAVQKQLSLAADEIFRILQNLMSEYDADISTRQCKLLNVALKDEADVHRTGCDEDISSEQQKCEYSEILQPSAQPQFINEMDQELIDSKSSHLHQSDTSNVTITMMGAETGGEQCKMLLSKHPEAHSEGSHVKSDKVRSRRILRQSQRAKCCKMCGRSFHKDNSEVKINIETREIAPANKSQATGRSCCRVCGKCFRYKRSFLKHVLDHEQSAGLCGVCGKRLRSAASLKAHLRAHRGRNGRGGQTDDGETSDSSEDWKASDGTDGDETNGASRSQKAKSKTQTQASNTAKRKKAKQCEDVLHLKYCCKVCGKSFCYRGSFVKHVQEDEGDADVCGVCGKHYDTEQSLRLHLQTHLTANDCGVCGKHFDGLKQLEMHMRTHTGEKPYVCSVCGRAFAQNGNLTGHMRAHTGEKPYACSVCGQSFGFKEYMVAHMRIHTGEKPFLCSICGKGFRQRGTLRTHTMIHTGESTHQCVVCDKKFYKSGALKIHMRAHTGERPYLCNVCGKRFAAGSSLSKHMAAHEGERTHRCSVCGKGFLRSEDLEKHARAHGDRSSELTTV